MKNTEHIVTGYSSFPDSSFRKSTASGKFDGNLNCVEVAMTGEEIGVRDSKDPEGPVLRFTHGEWNAFIRGVRDGEFDPS